MYSQNEDFGCKVPDVVDMHHEGATIIIRFVQTKPNQSTTKYPSIFFQVPNTTLQTRRGN